jgi:hypothetical protein
MCVYLSHFRPSPVTLGLLPTLIEAGRISGLYSRLLPGVPQRSKPQGNSSPFGMPIYGLRGTFRPEVGRVVKSHWREEVS